ncbi:MAG: MSHA biogenesis protein MshJ [Nitrosomonadales bacterium]|nr:MAG: MSHA biogenesis protein MshJ [Nitrosomonadales bacterium]
MKQQWVVIAAKVQALSQRERVLLLASLLAVVWKVFDITLISSAAKQKDIYRNEITTKQEQVTKLAQQEVDLIKKAKTDPEAENKAHLASLKQRVAQMDADIQVMGRNLVEPTNMPYVLESILQQDKQLKLVSLKTLPVSGLLDGAIAPGAKDTKAPLMGIYKHGFQLTLEGGYFDLLHYVMALEASPWRTLWGNIGINVGAYPKSTLTLTLYTLSLDKIWLSF